MAREKALAVSLKAPDDLVLAADTVVEIEGDILNKPESAEEAHAMLRRLSGRTHTVITAFAVARDNAVIESTPIQSRVTFRELADDVDRRIYRQWRAVRQGRRLRHPGQGSGFHRSRRRFVEQRDGAARR